MLGFTRVLGLIAFALAMAANVVSAQTGDAITLPAAVQKAFQQAYPTAAVVRVTQERDGDRPALRVESLDKGSRRFLLYETSGSLIETAEPVEQKDLPPPVAARMRDHPNGTYGGGLKVTRGQVVQYRLTLKGIRKPSLVVKADGTVVSHQ